MVKSLVPNYRIREKGELIAPLQLLSLLSSSDSLGNLFVPVTRTLTIRVAAIPAEWLVALSEHPHAHPFGGIDSSVTVPSAL